MKSFPVFKILTVLYSLFLISLSFLMPSILDFLLFHGYLHQLVLLLYSLGALGTILFLFKNPKVFQWRVMIKLVLVTALFFLQAKAASFEVERVHMIFYAFLALLYDKLFEAKPSRRKRFLYALCTATLIGMADETLQYFVPGRQATLGDIYLNFASAFLMLAALHILRNSNARS